MMQYVKNVAASDASKLQVASSFKLQVGEATQARTCSEAHGPPILVMTSALGVLLGNIYS